MMKRTVIWSTVALAMTAGVASAATCADRAHVTTQLEKRFGETLYANAVSKSNNVLEVYASDKGETWSILVYLPERNLSCLAATGRGLDKLEAALQLQ